MERSHRERRSRPQARPTDEEMDDFLDFLEFKEKRSRFYSSRQIRPSHSPVDQCRRSSRHSRSPYRSERVSTRRSRSRSRMASYSRHSPYARQHSPSDYSEYSSGSPTYTEKSLEASGNTEVPAPPPASASKSVAASGLVPPPDLPPILVEALGKSTQQLPITPAVFHSALAEAWLQLLQVEVTKEWRQEARREFPVPENCRRLCPPKLNAEIVAALPSNCKDRDSRILERQSGVSAGLVALGTVISEMLSTKEERYANWISQLSKSAHFFLDTYAEDSAIRRSLALGNLNPSVREVLKSSTWGDFLFGDKLKEDITVAKQISQSASELVVSKPVPAQPKTPSSSSNSQQTYQGSYQGGQRSTKQSSSRQHYSSHQAYQQSSSRSYQDRRDNRKR